MAIELVPGERVVLESVRSPFPMRVTYAFGERPDGTLMRIRVEGEPKGFYRLGGPLMTRQVKTSLNRDLETFRALLEGWRDAYPRSSPGQ